MNTYFSLIKRIVDYFKMVAERLKGILITAGGDDNEY